jgi:hypothetical protein
MRGAHSLYQRSPEADGGELTGVAIAGAGYFWKVILEFFAGISRKVHRPGL